MLNNWRLTVLKKYLMCLSLVLSGCAGPAIVGGISTVGLSAVEDRGLSGVTSDQVLRVKINFELEEKLEQFTDYELTIYKGRVLVTGIAHNANIKANAIQIIKRIEGVKEVIDGLNVKGSDGFSEYTRDGWITTKLKTTLYADHDIYAPNFLIRTFDKTVYIFGTAQTREEQNKVLEYARDITGVKKVVNLIEVAK